MMITRIWPLMLASLFTLLPTAMSASSGGDTQWITVPDGNGGTKYLADDRRPSLYTKNFGDCLGGSLINVSRFDAAYYADNGTVLFHLEGTTPINNESLVMYIGVYAYGKSRFDLIFNPCKANIDSLCPLNSSIPIAANGYIPIAPEDVATIPSLAYDIPDFEGQAILRIFGNTTQQEIACYSAVVTNGRSFSQPKSVGTVLGIFTLITVIASFATAIYGEAVPTMRLHYAHSLSVGVVMAVFQHIFFSGALSVNWPSVLVAWWSNFAWAGGMIHSDSMQSSINRLIGNNIGSTSQVGAAPADSSQAGLGGGFDISSIYKRSLSAATHYWPANHPLRRDMLSEVFGLDEFRMVTKRDILTHHAERALAARDTVLGKADGYNWYGHAVGAGLPLPGNYSGFAGTLAEENIRVSNAFMTGFLWFLILLVLLVAAVVAFKGALEGLAKLNAIKGDRLRFFREHWMRYTGAVALRTCYIGFFLMMFLTIFEFTYQSSAGVKAVAGIVFAIFIVGIPGVAWYACYYKKHLIIKDPTATAGQVERKKLLGLIPVAAKTTPSGETNVAEPAHDEKKSGMAFWKRKSTNDDFVNNSDAVNNIHDYDDYTMKFGWLSSRFRRSRWNFFTIWIFYEFLRAVFYAGASGYALAQVFGLLIIEFCAFIYIIWARPFEGRRLNVLVVYCLGFSKVASVGLSAAFDVHFNIERITATVIGIVIVIIQGILVTITMIAVIVGAISSYMSVSRNHEQFRPKAWHGIREKYFDHLDRVVNDLPREPKPKKPKRSARAAKQEAEEAQPGFEVKGIRRENKIEDDDTEFAFEMRLQNPNASYLSMERNVPSPAYRSGAATPTRQSRAPSVASVGQSNLPYGARAHRPSWSTRDFSPVGAEEGHQSITPIDMNRTVSDDANVTTAPPSQKRGHHSRSASLTSVLHKSSAPAAAPKPHPSAEELRVGGDVSTRDTIGMVPAPVMRPRSNTHGSRNSRSGTPVNGLDDLDEDYDPQPGPSSQRGSRYPPLTPTQEMDEWSTPKQSYEQR